MSAAMSAAMSAEAPVKILQVQRLTSANISSLPNYVQSYMMLNRNMSDYELTQLFYEWITVSYDGQQIMILHGYRELQPLAMIRYIAGYYPLAYGTKNITTVPPRIMPILTWYKKIPGYARSRWNYLYRRISV